jgi:hypothetical protein
MSEARCYNVNRHPCVEQCGAVTAAQIVEADGEAEFPKPLAGFLGHGFRIAKPSEIESLAGHQGRPPRGEGASAKEDDKIYISVLSRAVFPGFMFIL